MRIVLCLSLLAFTPSAFAQATYGGISTLKPTDLVGMSDKERQKAIKEAKAKQQKQWCLRNPYTCERMAKEKMQAANQQ